MSTNTTKAKSAKRSAKTTKGKATNKVKKAQANKPAKANPANATPTRTVVVKEIQNGQTKPKAGTACAQVWALCDTHHGERAQVLADGLAAGINKHTVTTQLARWRTYNGIIGRAPKPAAIAPVTA